MTGSIREVAPIRAVAQRGARKPTESAVTEIEGESPREWVPVDSPQVPAGEGHLENLGDDITSNFKVGAKLDSIREAGGREVAVGAYHSGGGRWHEEELAAWQWFGVVAGGGGQQHHHQCHHRGTVSRENRQ